MGSRLGCENWSDLYKMKSFGKATANQVHRGDRARDLFLGWSSFSLETLRLNHAKTKVIVRDSAHIFFQNEVLRNEYGRLGLRYPDRSDCLERELAEYDLADRILLLSRFAKKTFVDRGVPEKKLKIIPLGIDVSVFHPPPVLSVSLPLKVVYFGTLSIQKGIHYLLDSTAQFSPKVLEVHLIGHKDRHFRRFLSQYRHAHVHRPMPHAKLAEFIRGMHAFVFPTLHDGFGLVLPQAMASGLVPIVSDQCGAVELVQHGSNGFVIPPQSASAIAECLHQLIDNPAIAAQMRREACTSRTLTTWDDYGAQLRGWVDELSR